MLKVDGDGAPGRAQVVRLEDVLEQVRHVGLFGHLDRLLGPLARLLVRRRDVDEPRTARALVHRAEEHRPACVRSQQSRGQIGCRPFDGRRAQAGDATVGDDLAEVPVAAHLEQRLLGAGERTRGTQKTTRRIAFERPVSKHGRERVKADENALGCGRTAGTRDREVCT